MLKRNSFLFAGASGLKQEVSPEAAQELVAAVDEITEMFKKAKVAAKK